MTDMPPAVSNVQNGVNSILSVAYHLGGAPALQPLANAYLASVATCIEMYLGKDQAIASLLSMVQVHRTKFYILFKFFFSLFNFL